MKKMKGLSILLSLCMVLSLMPVTALAAEPDMSGSESEVRTGAIIETEGLSEEYPEEEFITEGSDVEDPSAEEYTTEKPAEEELSEEEFEAEGPSEETSGLKNNGTADLFAADDERYIVVENADGEAEICEKPEVIEPQFKGHAILLTGQIGLQFFLQLPEGTTPEDYPDSYVTFEGNKINGATQYPLPAETTVIDGQDGGYLFTVNLSSIQMADKVTPTFHYTEGEEEKTVTGDPYSAEDYITWGMENTTGKILGIVKALADYGYYAQPYLSAQNGWTIGTDYAEMKEHVTESYVHEDVKAEAKNNAIIKGTNDRITKVSYRMRFGSTITLRITFTPASGVKISTVTVNGEEVTPKKSGGKYYVDIVNIKATELATTYSIIAEGAETKVSPMSYVYGMLISSTTSDEGKDLVCALFNYAQACAPDGDGGSTESGSTEGGSAEGGSTEGGSTGRRVNETSMMSGF